jgi:hypothetical protein
MMATEPVLLRTITVPEFDIKVYEVTHADGSVEKWMHHEYDLEMQMGHLTGLNWFEWKSNPIIWMTDRRSE